MQELQIWGETDRGWFLGGLLHNKKLSRPSPPWPPKPAPDLLNANITIPMKFWLVLFFFWCLDESDRELELVRCSILHPTVGSPPPEIHPIPSNLLIAPRFCIRLRRVIRGSDFSSPDNDERMTNIRIVIKSNICSQIQESRLFLHCTALLPSHWLSQTPSKMPKTHWEWWFLIFW